MISKDVVELLLKVVIYGVLLLFYNKLSPLIKDYRNKMEDDTIFSIACDAVRAAEQTVSGNQQKKEWVMQKVADKYTDMGIEMTTTELSNIIESAVYAVKKEM